MGCFAAAVVGDQVGYLFGRRVGPALFRRPDSRIFKQEYVEKAQAYFEEHGSKTIVLARFVPVVRTFAPIVAGVGRMQYRTFVMFNVLGGLLWAVGITTSATSSASRCPDRQVPAAGHRPDHPALGIPILLEIRRGPAGPQAPRPHRADLATRSRSRPRADPARTPVVGDESPPSRLEPSQEGGSGVNILIGAVVVALVTASGITAMLPRPATCARRQLVRRRRPGLRRLRRPGHGLLGAARLHRLPRLHHLRRVAGGRGDEAVSSLQQLADGAVLPGAGARRAHRELVCYGRSVAGEEWEQLEDGTLATPSTPGASQMFRDRSAVEPEDGAEQSAYDRWLDQTAAREERAQRARARASAASSRRRSGSSCSSSRC